MISKRLHPASFSNVNAQLAQITPNGAVLTNLVTNGDFSNGTTGWSSINANISVVSGELNISVTALGGDARKTLSVGVGKKIYVACKMKTSSPDARLTIYDTDESYANYAESGSYEYLSLIRTTTASNLIILLRDYSSPGNIVYVDNVLAIDLTATFGAGNEPTAAQMDELLAFYGNSWFNGNANITDLLQYVVSRKANIAQEAWITPTLINGAIQYPTHPVQYYKDQFGRVYFRGRASNVPNDKALFTMPTGYRPPVIASSNSFIAPKSAMGVNFARIMINGGWGDGVVYVIISAPDVVYFDGFNYSVEV